MLPAFLVSDTTLRLTLLLLLIPTLLPRLADPLPLLATGQENSSSTPLNVEEVELDVRLEPATYTLSAKVMLGLRSRSLKPVEAIRLVVPAPFADRAHIYAVWDRSGFLAWHSQRIKKDLLIVTTFAQPIGALGQRWLVIRFDLDFTHFDAPDAPAQLTPHAASLRATGWYPLPLGVRPRQFNKLRLGLRLPRTWRLRSHAESKHLHTGTEFTEYELTAEAVSASSLLFCAYAQ